MLQAIQLGTADNSIRFRAKTVGVVEKAVGVDKSHIRHISPWPQGCVSCPPSSDKPCVPGSRRSEAGTSRGQTFAAARGSVAA